MWVIMVCMLRLWEPTLTRVMGSYYDHSVVENRAAPDVTERLVDVGKQAERQKGNTGKREKGMWIKGRRRRRRRRIA